MTLGANEVGDLEVVVHYLRQRFPKAMIGLWGRSMGAVTALLFSHKDPSIAGVVGSLLAPPPSSCPFPARLAGARFLP